MKIKLEVNYQPHIVEPLDMYDNGGLTIVFARAGRSDANDDVTLSDMSLPLVERAIDDAGRKGQSILDLTRTGIAALKKQYPGL